MFPQKRDRVERSPVCIVKKESFPSAFWQRSSLPRCTGKLDQMRGIATTEYRRAARRRWQTIFGT